MINLEKASVKGTRGNGILENFLTRQRIKAANRLIPPEARSGRILDIGCGTNPLFLKQTTFQEKYGLDRINGQSTDADIKKTDFDFEKHTFLPYDDNFFDIITSLAVIEHIETEKIVPVFHEIKKKLKPGGIFILTTPAAWTDKPLRVMAKCHLVSPEEVEEHKSLFTRGKLVKMLEDCDFPRDHIESGYFECFANLWAKASK